MNQLDRIAAEWLAARDVIATALREWGAADWTSFDRAEIIIARLAAHDPPILLEMERLDDCATQDCGHAARWLAYHEPTDTRSERYCVFCELERLHELETAAAEFGRLDTILFEQPDTLWPDDLTDTHGAAYVRLRTICREIAKARKP